MNLTKNQFETLVAIEKNQASMTQRELGDKLTLSLGTVNKTMNELKGMGLINSKGALEPDGIAALEPYRVKRAIIIAAGFGSRLVPITLNTPKPLVRVKGVRIIDTLLDQIQEAGIKEIHLVRGYLGEQFDQLNYKYPGIIFHDNPLYNEANNISSAFFVRNLLENAYVCEADLLCHTPGLITKYQYHTNYLAFPTNETDDWCFYEKNGIITRMSIGGEDCYQMVGISYWDEKDGKEMAGSIAKVFAMPGGKERYWDQVALEFCLKDYQIAIRPCKKGDIVEIDTFNELKAIDPAYS